MKRVILHIGQPKTGSTAIQQFLDMNIETINELGIDYYLLSKRYTPWQGGYSNGHFLCYEVLNSLKPTPEFKKANEINPSDHEFMLYCDDEESRKELKAEIERFKQIVKEYDTYILSEEVFFHCAIFYPDFWEKLKQLIESCFEEEIIIDCLLYLRRQDMWILSKYKEGVRDIIPWRLDFNQTVEEYKRIGYLDYNKIVLDLEKVFGKDHIIVRDYNRNKMYKNSIIPDFFEATGLSYPEEIAIPEISENTSLTAEVAQALFCLRSGKYNYKIKSDVYFNATEISKLYPEKKLVHFLSKEERIELVKEYEQGNKELGKRYTDSDNLFSEIDDDNPVYIENPLKERLLAKNIASDNPFLIKILPLKLKLYKAIKEKKIN